MKLSVHLELVYFYYLVGFIITFDMMGFSAFCKQKTLYDSKLVCTGNC